MENKQCPKCGEAKPLTDYAKDKSRRDGLQAYCRPCVRQVWQNWADRNRERLAEAEAARRQDEVYRAYQAEVKREWQGQNRTRLNEQSRNHYAANAAPFHARRRRWYEAHKEQMRLIKNAWNAKNPDKVKAIRNRRRARANEGGHFTAQEWKNLRAQFGNVCLACGLARTLTADHVKPLFHGGSNNIDNIQPLCGPCNSRKGTRIIDYRP